VLAAALAFSPLPVSATVEGWPALCDVAGVPAGDGLTVRAAPSAGAPVVGALEPGARGVEVVAVHDRQTWGPIDLGEGTRWVSLAFLARRPGQWEGLFPEAARRFGTEPFWELDRSVGTARWSAPEDAAAVGPLGAPQLSLTHRGRQAVSARLMPEAGGAGATALRCCAPRCARTACRTVPPAMRST
jgi:hypothetical protein